MQGTSGQLKPIKKRRIRSTDKFQVAVADDLESYMVTEVGDNPITLGEIEINQEF